MQTTIARMKRAAVITLGDLGLFASLCLARLMVGRTIRTRQQERLARLKRLKLISGGGQALGRVQAPMSAGKNEKGQSREAVNDSGFRRRG